MCLGHSIKGNLLGFDSGNEGEVRNPINVKAPSWALACLITSIYLLQICDIGSCQVFTTRDFFMFFFSFLGTLV